MSGRFISVEGVEGAGKTTQLTFIGDYLRAAGKTVVLTREPGGTALGEEIRGLLLRRREDDMAVATELLLMFAARAEHIEKVIQPGLAAGHWVLCDRFTDATYAYQGGGRGVDRQRIAALETWVQGSLRPDLTLLFDLPVSVGLARAGRRGRADRIESETLDFFQRVRDVYRQLAAADPDRYRLIDASASVAVVRTRILGVLDTLL